ncbi:hypothetical protein I0C86_38925 [Plantactinospora sp. S1510]|uniref:Exo-alpha-sialidase n=1 Tax=Plantactinospora alkalitolerans TaxID=2789879 RepID=A0ABS0H8Q5_9ACTN|nr:hypothetical protein [Plantactinospora alkalitolerans]MBF9134856.1 hypothetical protein [Plantactinospora alkalitolerans]
MQTYPFDSVEVAEVVVQPPLADLTERATRRVRHRRRIASVAAAGVLVLATVAVVPMVRGLGGLSGPTDQAGSAGSYRTETVVVDRRTVVAVRYGECGAVFSFTTDAGRNWSPYRGPVPWRECGRPVTTSYALLGPAVYVATMRGVRYRTVDFGATWQQHDEGVYSVDEMPKYLRRAPGDTNQFVNPVTGSLYKLAPTNTPVGNWRIRRAPDGTLWAVSSGADPDPAGASPVPEVIRSEDFGRTWIRVPGASELPEDPILVPAGPKHAYLLGECEGRTVVLRTEDGGESWFTTDVAWSVSEVGTITADGHLLIGAWDVDGRFSTWLSRDGGRNFDKGDTVAAPGTASIGEADGSVWVASGEGWAATSGDGRWQMTLPRDR